ncbi:MAG: ribosome recycling factor [Planctomycetota bacterium]|jgi:ribosome recycling factor|nr:ribosome recycling factor [Planctomycetota bacterium]
MPYDDIVLEVEDKMEKALNVLTTEFKGVRTGRASLGMVDPIRVDYFGAPTPLKSLASITVPEPRMIMIKPFDPASTDAIEKAILKSEVGLTPQSDGKILRLPVPPLSEERRKQIAKMVKDLGEKAKVSLRNIRRDANSVTDKEEKEKVISEDEQKSTRDEVDRLIKSFEKRAGDLVEKKTVEVLEV